MCCDNPTCSGFIHFVSQCTTSFISTLYNVILTVFHLILKRVETFTDSTGERGGSVLNNAPYSLIIRLFYYYLAGCILFYVPQTFIKYTKIYNKVPNSYKTNSLKTENIFRREYSGVTTTRCWCCSESTGCNSNFTFSHDENMFFVMQNAL